MSSLLCKSRWILTLFAWSNPKYPAQAVEKRRSPALHLITLVVPYGEVGIVSSLGSQAVVEVLAIAWVVVVHCAHCLDQLREGHELR